MRTRKSGKTHIVNTVCARLPTVRLHIDNFGTCSICHQMRLQNQPSLGWQLTPSRFRQYPVSVGRRRLFAIKRLAGMGIGRRMQAISRPHVSVPEEVQQLSLARGSHLPCADGCWRTMLL